MEDSFNRQATDLQKLLEEIKKFAIYAETSVSAISGRLVNDEAKMIELSNKFKELSATYSKCIEDLTEMKTDIDTISGLQCDYAFIEVDD